MIVSLGSRKGVSTKKIAVVCNKSAADSRTRAKYAGSEFELYNHLFLPELPGKILRSLRIAAPSPHRLLRVSRVWPVAN